MAEQANLFKSPFPLHIHPARGASVAGVGLCVLGILAILAPFVVGIAVTYVVAVLLLLGAVALATLAIGGDHTVGQRILGVIAAIILLLGGIAMVVAPGLGLMSLTAGLAMYLFMSGFARIMGSFLMPPNTGRFGVGISGVLGIVLGFLLLRQWPFTGRWAIGVLIGADLLFHGFALIGEAVRLRHFGEAISPVAA